MNPKRASSIFNFVLGLGMPYYKEGCKFRWFEEDRMLKSPHEHLDIVLGLLVVGSPSVSREFRPSKVLACGAESSST